MSDECFCAGVLFSEMKRQIDSVLSKDNFDLAMKKEWGSAEEMYRQVTFVLNFASHCGIEPIVMPEIQRTGDARKFLKRAGSISEPKACDPIYERLFG